MRKFIQLVVLLSVICTFASAIVVRADEDHPQPVGTICATRDGVRVRDDQNIYFSHVIKLLKKGECVILLEKTGLTNWGYNGFHAVLLPDDPTIYFISTQAKVVVTYDS